MAETHFTIARDLDEAQAMAKVLVPYVYEDTLYQNISGGRAFFAGGTLPSMTLGALLLRLRRLSLLREQMTDSQRATLAEIQAQHDSVLDEWQVHYESKLTQEALSRLNAMQPYFDECKEDRRLCASAYLPEAFRRTIVQEILFALEALSLEKHDVTQKTQQIDSQLHGLVKPTDFLWAEILLPVYPMEPFWWLYGKPPQPN